MTTKEATKAAKQLGYDKVNERVHGNQPVFRSKKGKPKYITPDVDSHNGGTWKGAGKIEDLDSDRRDGTYDEDLKKIKK